MIVRRNLHQSNLTMTRTPVRISFFGGGTDYPEYFEEHGGAVLSTAIDKYSYVTASKFLSKLFDHSLRVSYSKVELVKNVEEIEHRVYRECLKFLGLTGELELHNVADMPSFSGLGSSSTFTVGLLQALHKFKGEIIKGIQLAYEAIHIEREILKENVGCQDQTAAAVGGFNIIEFHKVDDIRVTPLPISPARVEELNAHVFLVFTTITRRAHDVVEDQLKRVGQNTEALGDIRRMVDRGYDILTSAASLDQFGELLHEAWVTKQSLSTNISNTRINDMYQLALDNGALGGKLLGAGGGGFLMLFAPPEKHNVLRSVFSDDQIVDVAFNAPGAEIII